MSHVPIVVCALVACACAACAHGDRDSPAPAPLDLNVSATRGATAMALTSEEPGPIGGCSVVIRGQGDREWRAVIEGRVAQHQTIVIPWTDFRAGDEQLPPAAGLERNDFVATCYMDIEDGLNLTGENARGRMQTTLHF